jgi:hypothetical protein
VNLLGDSLLARAAFAEDEYAGVLVRRHSVDALLERRDLAALAKELAPAVAEEFTGIARELGLTQEGVDKLVDLHGRLMLESVKAAEAQRTGWADECAKQGLATDQGMANARLAVKTFGGSAAMDALIQTGAAWHPAVQKFLQNIGSLLQEDNGTDGKPAGKNPSAADMMFPNSKYE